MSIDQAIAQLEFNDKKGAKIMKEVCSCVFIPLIYQPACVLEAAVTSLLFIKLLIIIFPLNFFHCTFIHGVAVLMRHYDILLFATYVHKYMHEGLSASFASFRFSLKLKTWQSKTTMWSTNPTCMSVSVCSIWGACEQLHISTATKPPVRCFNKLCVVCWCIVMVFIIPQCLTIKYAARPRWKTSFFFFLFFLVD